MLGGWGMGVWGRDFRFGAGVAVVGKGLDFRFGG